MPAYTSVMREHLQPLLANLRSLDPSASIDALQRWSQTATYRDAVSLVHAAPVADQAHLAAAIRDVMCGYPDVLYVCPVLLHWQSDSQAWLDLPDPQSVRDPDGTQWRWQALRRMVMPWESKDEPVVGIVAHQIQLALLVAQSRDGEPPVLHDDWLGMLFRNLPEGDTLHVSARMVLPWTDGVEAGIVLRSAALNPENEPERPNAFLSQHAWEWAVDAGRVFRHFADV